MRRNSCFGRGFLFLSAPCFASRLEKGAWHQRRKCGMVFRSHGKIAWCLGLAPGKPVSPAQTCLWRLPPPPPPPHAQLRALTSALCHSHPWVPSRIPDPAGSLSCRAHGPPFLPALPLSSCSLPALQGSFLHLQGRGLGSHSSPSFGAEILGAGHPWVTPFLLQAGTGLLAFPAAGPSLSRVRHQPCLETFPSPCDPSPRTRA